MQVTPPFTVESIRLNNQTRQRRLKEEESKSNLVFWNLAWLLINGVNQIPNLMLIIDSSSSSSCLLR